MQENLRFRTDLGDDDRFNGVWARLIGHTGHRDGHENGIYEGAPEFDFTFGGVQVGADIYRRENDDGSRDHGGLYFAFGRGSLDVRHTLPDRTIDAGRNEFDTYSIGAYWTRYGDKDWYIDGVIQGTWYDFRIDSPRDADAETDGFGLAVSVEGGYPFRLENNWIVEPQAQLVFQNIDIDDLDDGAATTSVSDQDSLAGRLGGMLIHTSVPDRNRPGEPARRTTFWGRLDLWHEFLAEPAIELSGASGSVPFTTDRRETWVEIGVGTNMQFSRTGVFYANVNYETSLDADDTGIDGRLGVRWNW